MGRVIIIVSQSGAHVVSTHCGPTTKHLCGWLCNVMVGANYRAVRYGV